ncbi:long-chain fatty acid--CoA ligase [Paraburkholderia caballeronis]|uniref:long-chain fatty acid--CoA ligase n=1 Tax=Paraburkholderia caballeronis TaxID=416943 RepID=UPI0010659FDD|nr:long-chain fatty acid--CoA ligase [Paraburkholderia caballeronis]TDV11562.1 fatty-acyl-CoA synthase [Paraburkholderia caballeronis]TDV17431.1 fatty-acyl-CoA synthase [Paraburkholderia caballeronis]TDV27449.1 fatty-acyl-CoA synthase [Paraburkholderia caballeronis]
MPTTAERRPQSPHWPRHLASHLTLPETNLFYNAEVSAVRYPDKPFIVFYDTPVSFAEFKDEAERIAGFLQHECGVQAGDRVLLYMQNSPQWVIAYYGILRANAVVVPVNPMNLTDELAHYVEDSGATTAFVAQDLYPRIAPLVGGSEEGAGLRHLIVATYSDYLKTTPHLAPPEFVSAPRHVAGPGVLHWADALAARHAPGPLTAGPDDLCVMPYTSGTTGKPKGCMHTHRSVMSTAVGGVNWFSGCQDSIQLSVLPLFHVTGMQGGMNGPLFSGSTIVLLPRWDRDAAARAIGHYRINGWQAISTMVVDFVSNPRLGDYDLSSLAWVRGGGATMPDAVVKKLRDLTGLEFVEGYGMSETMAGTHINPPQRPKPQCLGIPVFDVDARVIDPVTLEEVAPGETGELVMHAPQVMQGYWRDPKATRDAFIERDGRRFLRTGDLVRCDDEGYYFMTDRLKRMINASGYKVWPAEVEALMYRHPAIKEVCVIGAHDARRGETVKAVVVLDPNRTAEVREEDVVAWAHDNMAAYKAPRIVEFVDALPKSGSGKILWRKLQEEEAHAHDGGAGTRG